MRHQEWDIRRNGRAWESDEFDHRIDLRPEKLEVWEGKLLWSDKERVDLLGLLLENLGADHAVRLGHIDIWRDAIATRWLREVKAADPAYQVSLRNWASEFIESTVKSDMENFRVPIEIGNLITGAWRAVDPVLVNAESVLSWIPADVLEDLAVERTKIRRFRRADDTVVERSSGFVLVRTAGVETQDEVVFAERGDPVVLGARSLDGLNLRIDPLNRRLVDAGPSPAA